MITIAGLVHTAEMMEAVARALEAEGIACACTTDLEDSRGSQLLRSTEILLTLGYPCGAREMDLAPRLHAIVSPSIGYEWIDVAEATKRAIAVVNGEVPENRESMAEATILLMLALLYRLQATESALRNGNAASSLERHMLKGKTVGVIGYGGIARALISKLQNWGCNILIHSRNPQRSPGIAFVSLDDLLAASDIVVVLTNLSEATRHLLNRRRFQAMKTGVLLVNTSRGAIIDEAALVEALRSGRVAAAALDVFETEPLPADHPLRDLNNLILTPHAIGHTVEAKAAIPSRAATNVRQMLSGTLPRSCKNPEVAERWVERSLRIKCT